MNQNQEDTVPPVEIPLDVLSPEALSGVIEDFILREGTDYGRVEVSLEAKQKQVRHQIEKGDVKIVFDPATESVTLMTLREWKKVSSN